MSKKRIPWNKGKGKGWTDKRGYRWIYATVNGKRRAKREHRYILEQHLDRTLEPWEIVHHKDGNMSNNDISNLELTTHSTHTIGHHTGTHHTEATKRTQVVFGQLREEIRRLRRNRDTLEGQKADLLAACKSAATALNDHLQYDNGESLERDAFEVAVLAIAKAENN